MATPPFAGAGAGPGSFPILAALILAVLGLDALVLLQVVPAARTAGWPRAAPVALIAAADGLIYTLCRDVRALAGVPRGARLVPLLRIGRRGCWLLMLGLFGLILVRNPSAFDFR